ncbi:MAG: hypothetical protein ACI9YH_000759 [Colwellia sp.]|jgi:hypothetical protein
MCVAEYVERTAENRDVYLTKEEKAHSLCLCVSRVKSKSITLNI